MSECIAYTDGRKVIQCWSMNLVQEMFLTIQKVSFYMNIVLISITFVFTDCNVNCQNFLGQSPLIRAALFGDTETVKILIKAGMYYKYYM